MQKMHVRSLDQKEPLEKEMATHSSIFPGKPHGQRSLAGHSPWGSTESDTTGVTKQLCRVHHSLAAT